MTEPERSTHARGVGKLRGVDRKPPTTCVYDIFSRKYPNFLFWGAEGAQPTFPHVHTLTKGVTGDGEGGGGGVRAMVDGGGSGGGGDGGLRGGQQQRRRSRGGGKTGAVGSGSDKVPQLDVFFSK